MWNYETSCGNETSKIRPFALCYIHGKGVDIGCGQDKVAPWALGIDTMKRIDGAPLADFICDGTKLPMFADASLDFVYSSHFLEHTDDPKVTLAEWWRLLKCGGHLILYLPHKEFYPNIGQPGANPDHKHDFVPNDIHLMMHEIAAKSGYDVLESEDRASGNEYSFFEVYRKRKDGQENFTPWEKRKPEKSVIVLRYGAIGDMLMISPVLKALKDEGYHVTLQTHETGAELFTHSPYVDEIMKSGLQDNLNLLLAVPHWGFLEQRYDRIVNLVSSLENSLLSHPSQTWYYWPDAARRRKFNYNYEEQMAYVAGVDVTPCRRFHANAHEAQVIAQNRQSRRIVMLQLTGSAIHKRWPYMHVLAVRLLQETEAHVILTAGPECKHLQEQIMRGTIMYGCDTKRLTPAVGTFKIRDTLAFAQIADVIVGPETGVMSSAADEDNHKIVILSHSTEENLTKNWKNTVALTPINTPCYPCHRLHYGWKHCKQEPLTGASLCAANVSVDRVLDAVKEALCKLEPSA